VGAVKELIDLGFFLKYASATQKNLELKLLEEVRNQNPEARIIEMTTLALDRNSVFPSPLTGEG
jgi:hypothetical protein